MTMNQESINRDYSYSDTVELEQQLLAMGVTEEQIAAAEVKVLNELSRIRPVPDYIDEMRGDEWREEAIIWLAKERGLEAAIRLLATEPCLRILNGGDMATGYLHYSVENIEDTIDVETYDRALNEAAMEFGGEVEGTAFDPKKKTRTVRLTFNDVQTLEKFKTEVTANPPKLYRLKTSTHAEKVSKLKKRMDTFVGRSVKEVRVGTLEELNQLRGPDTELLWVKDTDGTDDPTSEVWMHVIFTDGSSITVEASSIGFPMGCARG